MVEPLAQGTALAIRDRLTVVIANAELARQMAEPGPAGERLARVLAAAWEADALLAEMTRDRDAA